MKAYSTIFFAIVGCTLLASCQSTYRYYQIYKTEPVKSSNLKNENGVIRFENDQCIITYHFWGNRGSADVGFYNKTNEILYIDLTKSFFIRNGRAYDLYSGRAWSSSSSTGFVRSTSSTLLGSVSASASVSAEAEIDFLPGHIFSSLGSGNAGAVSSSVSASKTSGKTYGSAVTTSQSFSETIHEKPIIAIPPLCVKTISTSTIIEKAYHSCDLPSCPADSAKIQFNLENSPLRFANYFTYTVGNNKSEISVSNEFYVSSIINIAEPDAIEFIKRDDICENLKHVIKYDTQTPGGAPLYDRYIKKGICDYESSFYYLYEVESSKRLYKGFLPYKYYPWCDAYTKFQGN